MIHTATSSHALRYRAIELFVLAGALWVLWYGVLQPSQQQVSQWQQRAVHEQAKLHVQTHMIDHVASNTLQAQWHDADNAWHESLAANPPTSESWLAGSGALVRTRFQQAVLHTYGRYVNTQAQLTLQGPFEALMQWLDMTHAADPTTHIHTLMLTAIDDVADQQQRWQIETTLSHWTSSSS